MTAAMTEHERVAVVAAVRAAIKKRTRELEKSDFVPAPGKRNATEVRIEVLTSALGKLTETEATSR